MTAAQLSGYTYLRDTKFVRSGNGQPPIAPRRLLLMLVSMQIRIVNRCCSGFPVSDGM